MTHPPAVLAPVFLVTLVLSGASGLTACDRNPVGPTNIQNVTWKLESIERAGSSTITIPNPEAYTVVFEADGRLNVKADCNTCTGRYNLNGASLSTSQVACTRAFCGTAIDTVFASALGSAQTVTVNGSQLLVQGTGLTLRFRD
jgi:heat shock protein HslJ